MIIKYEGFGHVSIVVEDIYKSVEFYAKHFGAIPLQQFPSFSQTPFTENLGFDPKNEKDVELTTVYSVIPDINLYFELMQYHHPLPDKFIEHSKANETGVINHLSLRVENIDEVFEYFKSVPDVEFLNNNPAYKPRQLNKIKPEQFAFFDDELEANQAEKQKVCDIISDIRFFIIKDFNGIHWEFESGHVDVGG